MSPGRSYHGRPLLEDVFAPAGVPYARQSTLVRWFGIAAGLAVHDVGWGPLRGVHGRFDLRRAAGTRSMEPGYYPWRVETRAYLPVFAKRRVRPAWGVRRGANPAASPQRDCPSSVWCKARPTPA